MTTQGQSTIHLPRVEIRFCVRCKWNLRAAYYAQELLQTFCSPPSEVTLGEISLVPVSGGIFTVTLYHLNPNTSTNESENTTSKASSDNAQVTSTQIWDRKADGGFPETKELKNRIRNLIDPERDMGHIDRSINKSKSTVESSSGSKSVHPSVGQDLTNDSSARETETISLTSASASTSALASKDQESKQVDQTDTVLPKIKPENGNAAEAGDCEDCRLAAQESLEDEVGRITSNTVVLNEDEDTKP